MKANITKNGVCYDIKHTPYTYFRNGLLYHFSSATHMDKFRRDVVKREEWLRDSFHRRFKILIEPALIADLQLYIMIESRGFYVENVESGVVYKCQEEITLDGLQVRYNACARQ